MLSRVLNSSPSQTDVSAVCLSPTTKQKSTSVVKCLSLGSMWMPDFENVWIGFVHKYNHIYTYVCICCRLTVFHLLFAVEPPSDLKFKILNENSVKMSWTRPSSHIEGFRLQVVSDAGQYVSQHIHEVCDLNPTVHTHSLYTHVDSLLNSFFYCRWTGERLYPWCLCHVDLNHWPDPWLGLLCVHKLLLWVRWEHSYLWTTDQ